MTIHLPLSGEERDITLLAGHFIEIFNKKFQKDIEGLSLKQRRFSWDTRGPREHPRAET